MDERDALWMRRALAEAERGRGWVEPNPMVGAVIVRDGRLIAVGHHARFGGPHAEVAALAQAGSDAKGATLYVTLEPCCHFGKTPPCTDAILAAGVARVVAAIRDPFPKVAGGGVSRLRDAGIAVELGLEADAARRLNAPYLKRLVTGRPYVTAKWAMTLDGKTAVAAGDSRWISGARSRALVHELRGRMDAIVVGIGTVFADDPLLTARPPGPRTAVRIVLDSAARLPGESQLARTAKEVPVCVAVAHRADPDRIAALTALGCDVLTYDDSLKIPIGRLLDEIGRRGATNVLVEGGGLVLGSFHDASEIDAVEVYVAPTLEGGTHTHVPLLGKGQLQMSEAPRIENQEVNVIDKDVVIRGQIAHPWREAAARVT